MQVQKLLDDAILAMETLHDEMDFDELRDCIVISPESACKFIDAHARLLYERNQLTKQNNCNV